LLARAGGLAVVAADGAADFATFPVEAVAMGVGLAPTSQSEADEKRGRELRKAEEKAGREAREREKACRKAAERGETCSPAPVTPSTD